MEFLPALSALRGVVRSALEQTDLSATSMKGMVSLLESRLGCAEGAIYADKDARRHCKAIINDLIPEVQAEQAAAAARGGQKRWQSASSASESGESDGWGEAAESEDDFAHTGPKGRKRAKDDAGGGKKEEKKKRRKKKKSTKKKAAVAAAAAAPAADVLAAHKVGCGRARARARARTHAHTHARARAFAGSPRGVGRGRGVRGSRGSRHTQPGHPRGSCPHERTRPATPRSSAPSEAPRLTRAATSPATNLLPPPQMAPRPSAPQRVAKALGVTLPWPRIAKGDSAEGKAQLAEEALRKASGLRQPLTASARELSEARKKRELEKEMEGIDTDNIVSGGRRRRTPRNYWEGEGADSDDELRKAVAAAAAAASDDSDADADARVDSVDERRRAATHAKPAQPRPAPAAANAATASVPNTVSAEENFSPGAPKASSAPGRSMRRALIDDSEDDE